MLPRRLHQPPPAARSAESALAHARDATDGSLSVRTVTPSGAGAGRSRTTVTCRASARSARSARRGEPAPAPLRARRDRHDAPSTLWPAHSASPTGCRVKTMDLSAATDLRRRSIACRRSPAARPTRCAEHSVARSLGAGGRCRIKTMDVTCGARPRSRDRNLRGPTSGSCRLRATGRRECRVLDSPRTATTRAPCNRGPQLR